MTTHASVALHLVIFLNIIKSPEYSGLYFFNEENMITPEGQFSFKDIILVSKNNRFMLEDRKRKNKVYEVQHDTFKTMLVLAAQAKGRGFTKKVNSFEFLYNQLEVTEDLFTALMYDFTDWTD